MHQPPDYDDSNFDSFSNSLSDEEKKVADRVLQLFGEDIKLVKDRLSQGQDLGSYILFAELYDEDGKVSTITAYNSADLVGLLGQATLIQHSISERYHQAVSKLRSSRQETKLMTRRDEDLATGSTSPYTDLMQFVASQSDYDSKEVLDAKVDLSAMLSTLKIPTDPKDGN